MSPDVFSTKLKQVFKSAFDCMPAVYTTLSFSDRLSRGRKTGGTRLKYGGSVGGSSSARFFVGPHQRLLSSKLKSCACADNAPHILVFDTHDLHGYLSKGFSCAVSGSRHQCKTSYLGKSAWL